MSQEFDVTTPIIPAERNEYGTVPTPNTQNPTLDLSKYENLAQRSFRGRLVYEGEVRIRIHRIDRNSQNYRISRIWARTILQILKS